MLLNPEVQVRLESGPGAAVHSPLAEQNGFLQCRLQAFSADFLMTSLRNLALFLGDDTASQVLPMEITIKDTHVNLKVRLDTEHGSHDIRFHNTIIMAERINDNNIIAMSKENKIMVSGVAFVCRILNIIVALDHLQYYSMCSINIILIFRFFKLHGYHQY